jgi:hypothetical protein
MQRRLRIALAVTAAAGAALLGTGTAFADSFTDILGGAGTSQASPSELPGGSDADSDDSDSDSSDSTDASTGSGDDDSSADDSSSDDN